MCWLANTESKQADSAARAAATRSSGRLIKPMLMWRSPSSISAHCHSTRPINCEIVG